MLSGERKKFGLRAARSPALIGGFSNTVIVYDADSAKYCFIACTPDFVKMLGAQLPSGVSTFALAHLVVELRGDRWVIAARYIDRNVQVDLWESAELPTWVKQLKPIRYNNVDHSTHRAPGSTGSTNTSADRRAIVTAS